MIKGESMSMQWKRIIWLYVFIFMSYISCAQKVGKLVPKENKNMAATLNVKDVNLNVNLAVDILFVVDDSGSMASHQKNLGANIALFTESFLKQSLLDFRITITTTSGLDKMSSIKLFGPFDKNMSDINQQLNNAFYRIGTDGHYQESVFFSSNKILDPASNYSSLYRREAFLVLVFVTDAEDQSDILAVHFRDFLIGLKGGNASQILTYGVLAKTTSSGQYCQRDGKELSLKIEELIRLFNGVSYSLCEPDFGRYLAKLGTDITGKISAKIPLNLKPLISTINVRYGSHIIPNHPEHGWIYDIRENALLFGYKIKLKKDKGKVNKLEVYFDVADN